MSEGDEQAWRVPLDKPNKQPATVDLYFAIDVFLFFLHFSLRQLPFKSSIGHDGRGQ
jgi:hypothetical protein